jgi:hypothetical protein
VSEEPNKKIEELLKAYAAKRKGEAADPAIHPATRKMLQEEVRRTFKKPVEGVAKQRVPWTLLWPKFAMGAAACALVILGFVLIREDSPVRFDVAQSPPPAAQSPQIRQLPAAPPPPESDALVSEDSVIVGGPIRGMQAEPSQVPAEKSLSLSDALSSRKEAELAVKAETATVTESPTGATFQTAGEVRLAASTTAPRQYFAEAAQPRAGGRPASTATQHPLQRFFIQPLGNRVRITDFDGSVYEGELVALSTREGKDKDLSATGKLAGVETASRALNDASNFRFEVSGTNRTLNQPVRFAGVYSTALPASTRERSQPTEEAKKSKADAAAVVDAISPLPSTRITGTLFINTNQVPINAILTAP